MTWLEFIVEMTKALAWPVALAVLLFRFRKPLLALIPQIGKVKYKDFELDFSRRLDEVATEIPAGVPTPKGVAEDPLIKLADTSPRAAILEAWLRVESAAIEFARARQIPVPKPESRVVTTLARSSALDSWQVSVLKDLRALRNSAAHVTDFQPSVDSAREYVRLALELEQTLRPAA